MSDANADDELRMSAFISFEEARGPSGAAAERRASARSAGRLDATLIHGCLKEAWSLLAHLARLGRMLACPHLESNGSRVDPAIRIGARMQKGPTPGSTSSKR